MLMKLPVPSPIEFTADVGLKAISHLDFNCIFYFGLLFSIVFSLSSPLPVLSGGAGMKVRKISPGQTGHTDYHYNTSTVCTLRKKRFQKGSSTDPIGEPFLVPGRTILAPGRTILVCT